MNRPGLARGHRPHVLTPARCLGEIDEEIEYLAGRAVDADGMLRLIKAGKFDAINDNLKSQEQACKGGGFKNNPVLALQCLQLCGASGGSCNLSVSLTRFEKIACEKATGEPGYVCDYIMRMSASSPAAQQALATIAPGGSTDQARFLKTAKGWIQLASRRRHPANFSVEVQRDTDESAQQLPACAQ